MTAGMTIGIRGEYDYRFKECFKGKMLEYFCRIEKNGEEIIVTEHKDPADRTIVTTAKLRNLLIITKDPLIRNFYPKTIW